MEQKADSNSCNLSVTEDDITIWSSTISCSDATYIPDLKVFVAGSYTNQSGTASGQVRNMKFETTP